MAEKSTEELQQPETGFRIKSSLLIVSPDDKPLFRLKRRKKKGEFGLTYLYYNIHDNYIFHGAVAMRAGRSVPVSLTGNDIPVEAGTRILWIVETGVPTDTTINIYRFYTVFEIIESGFEIHAHYVMEPDLESYNRNNPRPVPKVFVSEVRQRNARAKDNGQKVSE